MVHKHFTDNVTELNRFRDGIVLLKLELEKRNQLLETLISLKYNIISNQKEKLEDFR